MKRLTLFAITVFCYTMGLSQWLHFFLPLEIRDIWPFFYWAGIYNVLVLACVIGIGAILEYRRKIKE